MITAAFKDGQSSVIVSGLTQWDKGQMLQIQCSDLPEDYEVQFAIKGQGVALPVKPEEDQHDMVKIPDVLLQQTTQIEAWVYAKSGEDIGETVKSITLQISERPMPLDYFEEPAASIDEVLRMIEEVKGMIGAKTKIQICTWEDDD